jgi:2',3'-cyclic-nucleotide 2'-phosphodiesterase (5'-nucleotidase family)
MDPERRPMTMTPVALRIVAINDVYTLEQFPALATLLARLRSDPAVPVLATLAGDFLAPSLLSSLDAGRGMVDCLNALGFTHVCFGNHEDDVPLAEIRARAAEFCGTWLSTNTPDFADANGRKLPTKDRITVVDPSTGVPRTVDLIGVVIDDPTAYRQAPFGGVPVAPPNATVLAALAASDADMLLPLTHQAVAEDRALLAELAAAPGGFRVPLVLGGHDHTVFDEAPATTRLLKAGADAVGAWVVDVGFAGEVPVVLGHTLTKCSEFPENPSMRARVNLHMQAVARLEEATLFFLPPGETLSSVGTRSQQTSFGTFLCTKLRDATGADVCIFNGGGIRASKVYASRFTYGDLAAELPFDNELTVVAMPGAVLAAAIAFSRSFAPEERGCFLHTDDRLLPEAIDPARTYRVALVRNLLFGMDHIAPLVDWARGVGVASGPPSLPPAGAGREVKVVLIQAFGEALWRLLCAPPGSFDGIDTDHDGVVTEAELHAALLAKTGISSEMTTTLVKSALDTNRDGVIDRSEAARVEPVRVEGARDGRERGEP